MSLNKVLRWQDCVDNLFFFQSSSVIVFYIPEIILFLYKTKHSNYYDNTKALQNCQHFSIKFTSNNSNKQIPTDQFWQS